PPRWDDYSLEIRMWPIFVVRPHANYHQDNDVANSEFLASFE
ncbi:12355_t:CDS:1, partial [Entrophospora sp. SA101]